MGRGRGPGSQVRGFLEKNRGLGWAGENQEERLPPAGWSLRAYRLIGLESHFQ